MDIALKIFLTVCLLWTIINLYIIVEVPPSVTWARYSVIAWAASWVLTLVVAIIGVIWTP